MRTKLNQLAKKPGVVIAVVFVVALVIGLSTALLIKRMNTPMQSASCAGTCIDLGAASANPDVLTITSGTYVQFNNTDGSKHNIALEHAAIQHEDPTEFDSGDFGKGEAYKVQFKKDGAYTFRDKYHPKIQINVVVYTKGKDYKVQ